MLRLSPVLAALAVFALFGHAAPVAAACNTVFPNGTAPTPAAGFAPVYDPAKSQELCSSAIVAGVTQEYFDVSFNKDLGVANWVAYKLDPVRAQQATNTNTSNGRENIQLRYYTCCVARSDLSPLVQATTAHFDAAFEAGHMAPFRSMMYSLTALRDANYYTNIARMAGGLNGGLWRSLEEKIRTWATTQPTHAIVGPILDTPAAPTFFTVGSIRIAVPDQFFAIVVLKPTGAAVKKHFYILPNDGGKVRGKSLTDFELADQATFLAKFPANGGFDFHLP